MRAIAAFAFACLCAVLPLSASAQQAPAAQETPAETEARGREALAYSAAIQAYIFTFPLTITERERVRRERLTGTSPNEPAAPINHLGHMTQLATAQGDLPYSPNNDTVYSGLALDLTTEPIILSMPAIRDRYVSVHVADAYVENQPYLYSTRVNGGRAMNIAFVGPNWQGRLPRGVAEARMPTNLAVVTVRIAVRDEADLANVRSYQQTMSVTALSQWRGRPSAAPPTPPLPRTRARYEGDFAYFRRVADLMAENPPTPRHNAMREMMRRIGLVPGRPFDPAALDPATRAGVLRAERDGPALIENARRTRGIPTPTNWSANRASPLLVWDYPTRASLALVGLVGNDPEEALYYNGFFDANGAQLLGGRRYRMHFSAAPRTGALGFWSLTMYDAHRFQFVDNPIDRYAIGGRDALVRNADGSIDIYIQPEAPGGERDNNWLPSPATGEFKLTIRVYMPAPEVLDGYMNGTFYVPGVEPVP